MAKQFVVQLKNEPGAMATLAEALAARGVDLRAIGGGSMGDSGHVIMTTADDDTAKAVLDEKGYTYIEGESILAEVDDKPGGMARLSRALADAGVNIEMITTSEIRITTMIAEDQVEVAVRALHAAFELELPDQVLEGTGTGSSSAQAAS